MLSYPPKLSRERRFVTMDFTQQLVAIGTGVGIAPAPAPAVSVVVSPFGAQDPVPQAMLDGGPIVSGNVVGQWVQGGIAGANYVLTWEVTFTDGAPSSLIDRQRLLPVIAQY